MVTILHTLESETIDFDTFGQFALEEYEALHAENKPEAAFEMKAVSSIASAKEWLQKSIARCD
ncbi:hypothetical protein [Ohtaekwangia koreensis]|uniref:Uncharacterized protein n=1 Tax=Ohtaekwangia koreensis TaxID=688867 RepID=A0A1T5JU54_9BACT|nr:hypothetical protein [Ohtaekwangia koreensis]SKC54890.1 hypothetical protein SAMN05660236_1485 [Ohtaekwangia koreensis]